MSRKPAGEIVSDVVSAVHVAHPWLQPADRASLQLVHKEGAGLYGRRDGRLWIVSVYPDWKGAGTPGSVSVEAFFRGAPPGRERERLLPWFYLGSAKGVQPTPGFGNPAAAFAAARRDRARDLASAVIDVGGTKLVALSSFAGMEAALRGEPWGVACRSVSAFERRELLGPSYTPVISGFVHKLTVAAPLVLGAEARGYSALVDAAVRVAHAVESGFGGPTLQEVSIAVEGRPTPTSPFNEVPVYRCPRCGVLRAVREAHDAKGVPYNAACEVCYTCLFLSPPGIKKVKGDVTVEIGTTTGPQAGLV